MRIDPSPSGLEEGEPAAVDGRVPAVEVSEEALELARQELREERELAFQSRMEDRRSAALDGLDAFAEAEALSEEEVLAVEEAIETRFEAMGEAFAGEGMEGEARREHMRAVADAFEMQIIGALGEETGALYLEQTQGPRFGRVGTAGSEE